MTGSSLSVRIGAVLLIAFVLIQLAFVILLQLPDRTQAGGRYGLPAPAALAALVRAVDTAGPDAQTLVETFDQSLFTVRLQRAPASEFLEVPGEMASLARSYRAAIVDHNVVVDGGPGRLHRLLGSEARAVRFLAPIRVTVWLRDGRVLVVTGRPADGLQAYLARRSRTGLVLGLVLLATLWLALHRTTAPLRRLTASVQALGDRFDTPDTRVEGSREVRLLATAFNAMKRRLVRLIDQRTLLLAGITHDMRTYLTRLRLRAAYIADEDQRARAERDIVQMSSMLDDGLLFASLDHDRTPALSMLDLAALCREWQAAHPDAERIRLALPPTAIVMGEVAGLERIFANLVGNALRHATTVTIDMTAHDGSIAWRFIDDGPGVATADLPRLGTPYLRLDDARDRRTGGAGLGLAIVAGLAQAMGGDVAFGAAPDGGLAATVTLSLTE